MELQKLNPGSKVVVFLIIIFIVITGFVRDFLFVNINGQLYITYYHSEQIGVSELLRSIWGKSASELTRLKWILTCLFTIAYYIYTSIIIHLLFKQPPFLKLTTFSFGIIILISGLFTLVGLLAPGFNTHTYEVSRFLMGLVQSPIVLMILIPVFLLWSTKKQNS